MNLYLKPSEAHNILLQLRTLSVEKLPGSTKYAIYKNIEILDTYSKAFIAVRKDMFQQFAKIVNGNYLIPEFLDEKLTQINPDFKAYIEEIELIDQSNSITLNSLPKDIFTSDHEFSGDLNLIYCYLLE